MSPTVSVLLPAHNAARTLGAAVGSLLRQSLRDFELIVLDDGSTDGTAKVLAAINDERLRVLREDRNRGLVAALNSGIDAARGAYIARMDADDIAHPRRLEMQVSFLRAHPEVGICGTWFRLSGGGRLKRVRTPTAHDAIAAALFFRSAFGHPTVMFRRAFLAATGLRYRPSARHAEDFDLWVRARDLTRLANLPSYLLDYAVHGAQLSAQQAGPQADTAGRIRLEQLVRMVPDASEHDKRLHLATCDGHLFATRAELLESRAWLDFLEERNRRTKLFLVHGFGEALAGAWAHCCYRARFAGNQVFSLYLTRRYSGLDLEALRRYLFFAARAMRRV
jgi:glycosyltransferase involved in cell wall biosynthesis